MVKERREKSKKIKKKKKDIMWFFESLKYKYNYVK